MECPHCGQIHPESATFCPTTGKRIHPSQRSFVIPAIAVLLVIALVIMVLWFVRSNGEKLFVSKGSTQEIPTIALVSEIVPSSQQPPSVSVTLSTTEVHPSHTPPSSETSRPTRKPTPSATNLPTARTWNFLACLEPCLANGSNSSRVFPGKTSRIYMQWEYEKMSIGAFYIRRWTMDDLEWVRYECAWPGPTSGTEELTLTDPDGLHSGLWEITILIDGVVIMREQIEVEGNWENWQPVGVFDSCYGKR